MATAETRVSSWLFGGLFTTTVLVVLVLAVSTLTSALSAGLLMQLALGGARCRPKPLPPPCCLRSQCPSCSSASTTCFSF